MTDSGFLERVRHVSAQAGALLDKIARLPGVFNTAQIKTITTTQLQVQALRDEAHKQLTPDQSEPVSTWVSVYTGYACSRCSCPQFTAPSGATCVNGHGGADPHSTKSFPSHRGCKVGHADDKSDLHALDSITVDGSKYTFVEERTGGFRVDRNGEAWVTRHELIDIPGGKAFIALFFEAVTLKRKNQELERELTISRTQRS